MSDPTREDLIRKLAELRDATDNLFMPLQRAGLWLPEWRVLEIAREVQANGLGLFDFTEDGILAFYRGLKEATMANEAVACDTCGNPEHGIAPCTFKTAGE